jgi:multidrug efflux pump subunit AcrA (membrane-fusion protein)
MKAILRLALCGAGVALAACGGAPQPGNVREAAPAVNVSSHRVNTARPDAPWLGVVLPRQSLDLAPEIAGQVEQVYVREGDPVRRGQTVALLGTAYDRQEMAMAEVNVEGAQARVAVQQARVTQARDRLAKAELRAPADGKVTRRYVDPGALAGPSQPVLRLIGDGSLIVRFAAPPEQARSLRAAARLSISTEDGRVPAVIESVSPEVDPPSGMVIVVATLGSVAGVKPGEVVRVRREGDA